MRPKKPALRSLSPRSTAGTRGPIRHRAQLRIQYCVGFHHTRPVLVNNAAMLTASAQLSPYYPTLLEPHVLSNPSACISQCWRCFLRT